MGKPMFSESLIEEVQQGPLTYQIKLVCLNCGIKDFYYMPYGSEFMTFMNEEESTSGQREYSYIHIGGTKEERGVDHPKNCRNCGLAFLILDYWEAGSASSKKEKVKHG